MKCLLDMDGVLVNFVKSACEVHGRPDPFEDKGNWGLWDLAEYWGMPLDEWWEPFDCDFWRNLEWMPDGREIFDIVINHFGKQNVCLFSSPGLAPEALMGKKLWIMEHLPDFKSRYIFGSKKFFLAHPDVVLIDDYNKNILEFEKHGGKAIQVPRPWNALHSHVQNVLGWKRTVPRLPIPYLKEQLNDLG